MNAPEAIACSSTRLVVSSSSRMQSPARMIPGRRACTCLRKWSAGKMQSLSVNRKYGELLARTPSLRQSETRKPSCGWLTQWSGNGAVRELADQALCVIGGAVVGDDDFELAVHAALMGQRHERALEVRRTLVRREDHRDFELGGHENFRGQFWRGSVVENRLRGQDEPPLENSLLIGINSRAESA